MKIKELEKSDYHLLEEFIYWAIFVPPNSELPERNIISTPIDLRFHYPQHRLYFLPLPQ